MRNKYDTYYDLAFPLESHEGKYYKECPSCGEDIELDCDCLDAVQFYNVPSEDGETESICRKCFKSWVSGVDFLKEFEKLCEVSTKSIMKKEFAL